MCEQVGEGEAEAGGGDHEDPVLRVQTQSGRLTGLLTQQLSLKRETRTQSDYYQHLGRSHFLFPLLIT